MNPILKEIRAINLDRKGLFDGQAELCLPDESDLRNIDAVLTPNCGPFKDGKITFRLSLPDGFPKQSPRATCVNRIFHPNVGTSGSVCFNMFGSDGWTESYGLEAFVVGLLWLLSNPNPSSCLNSAAAIHDMSQYTELVQMSMRGIPVKGETFSTIVTSEERFRLSLPAWLVMAQSTAKSKLWFCPEAEVVLATMADLKKLGFDVLSTPTSALNLRVNGSLVPLFLVNGALDKHMSLVNIAKLPPDQTFFTCQESDAAYLPIVRKLAAAGLVLISKANQISQFVFGTLSISGTLTPDHLEVGVSDISSLPNLEPLVVIRASEAHHLPLVRKLQSVGPIKITSFSENSVACLLSGTPVSGAFCDGVYMLNWNSGKQLKNQASNPFNNCPLVCCEIMKIVETCTKELARFTSITNAEPKPDGSMTVFASYQGSIFACQALPEKGSIDIPFALHRRLLAANVDVKLLLCSAYAGVEGILEKVKTATGHTVIDATLAGPACWELRFSCGGTGRYLLDKKQVELSLAMWALLGKPEGIFTVPNRTVCEQLSGLTLVNTNMTSTAQVLRVGREVDGKQQNMFVIAPNQVPVNLEALKGSGPAWSVLRGAALGELLSEAEPVVVDPLLFALPSFFQVEERLCAKGDPEATANFFLQLSKSRDVQVLPLHTEIPKSSNYYFCTPTSTPPVLAPLVKTAA